VDMRVQLCEYEGAVVCGFDTISKVPKKLYIYHVPVKKGRK